MCLHWPFVATENEQYVPDASPTGDEIQPNGTHMEINIYINIIHIAHTYVFAFNDTKQRIKKTTGYLVTYAGVRFPGAEDIPAGFAALDALPGQVVAQMGFTLFLMEAANSPTPGTYNNFKPEFMGDFR